MGSLYCQVQLLKQEGGCGKFQYRKTAGQGEGEGCDHGENRQWNNCKNESSGEIKDDSFSPWFQTHGVVGLIYWKLEYCWALIRDWTGSCRDSLIQPYSLGTLYGRFFKMSKFARTVSVYCTGVIYISQTHPYSLTDCTGVFHKVRFHAYSLTGCTVFFQNAQIHPYSIDWLYGVFS